MSHDETKPQVETHGLIILMAFGKLSKTASPPGSGVLRPRAASEPLGNGATRPRFMSEPPGDEALRPRVASKPPGNWTTRPRFASEPPGNGALRPRFMSEPPEIVFCRIFYLNSASVLGKVPEEGWDKTSTTPPPPS